MFTVKEKEKGENCTSTYDCLERPLKFAEHDVMGVGEEQRILQPVYLICGKFDPKEMLYHVPSRSNFLGGADMSHWR